MSPDETSENHDDAKLVDAVLMRLDGLGPYSTKFVKYTLDYTYSKEALEELLVKKWEGAVPDCFIGTEEISRSIMNILDSFLEFAIEEAMRRKNCSRKEGDISYHVEPYYYGSSAVLIVDNETKTLLCRRYVKTYRLDKNRVETFLRNVVEDTCRGLDLVKKRKKGNDKRGEKA